MPAGESATEFEHAASSSQADTEPLPFDEDDTQQIVRQVPDATMAPYDEDQEDVPDSVQGTSPADTSMDDVDAAAALTSVGQQYAEQAKNGGQAPFSDALTGLEDEEDAQGEDDLDAMASDDDEDDNAAGADNSDTLQGGQDTGAANSTAGAGFSDGSELTDESDEEDDNDEMGGGSDDDEDEEDEEDEDAEGEDEDEAAEGLAALTGVRGSAEESGLDGLAVLAAAGAGDADDRLNEDSDSESVKSALPLTRTRAAKGRFNAKPRLGSRLNEVMVASEQTSGAEEEDDEDALNDENDEDGADGSVAEEDENALTSKSRTREMSSLGQFASAAKRSAARSGPAAGLLAGAPAITIEDAASGAASLATTPAGSPKADDEDGIDGEGGKLDGEEGDKAAEDDDDEKDVGLETPVQELEEAVADEDPSTDEAALRRQEAIDALTKIEIGFAVLRDKLYVERMEEISKEGEMILDGSHPDLIYLTNFIEARRERRLKLVDLWFAQQQKQYERVARVEEAATWNNWRNEVVQLRQQQLDEASRKRRKLDREKRSLDGPRPARRHQIFETELVRNPDYDSAKGANADSTKQNKKDIDPRQQELEDLDEMGAYVAYPDLRAADEQEAWMDMERIGIQPEGRMVPGAGYYRMDEMAMDGYPAMFNESQMMGRDMSGAYAGGSVGGGSQSHVGNGVMDERYIEPNVEIRDHHGRSHGYVDTYGSASTAGPHQRFSGQAHLDSRHLADMPGHARNVEAMYADEAHLHEMQSRKHVYSPGPEARHHMDERLYGVQRPPLEAHPKKARATGVIGGRRSPPPPMPKAGGGVRKSVAAAGGQRPMYGMDVRGHPDDGPAFYDAPPPSHMQHISGHGGPPQPPSNKIGYGSSGNGPGSIHDSPQQHHRQQQQHHMHPNAAPPPPRMPHPMQNGPMPSTGVRRTEPLYPH
jgi:hypothetical protein